MSTGLLFQANLNADKIYIDMKFLPDPVEHELYIRIQNQYLSTLYFKVTVDIPNWTLTTPADGQLGSVAGTQEKFFTLTMSRPKPSTETVESGTITIEAYSDSDYTDKVGEATLPVTVYFEDLESWTDVTIYDFNDGTSQGWTLSSNTTIENDASVETGGYSARYYYSAKSYNREGYIERSITLPNRNKVRVSFFLAFYAYYNIKIHDLSVLVNGEKVYDIPTTIVKGPVHYGWVKCAVDLSAYRGQTVTLRIRIYTQNTNTTLARTTKVWIDRIVIAGKD